MNTARYAIAAAVWLVLSLGTAWAQSAPLDEHAFWQRLERTNTLLQAALQSSNPDLAGTAAQIGGLWDGVSEVRLADGPTITVDVSWLILPPSARVGDLRQLQARVQAVLDYQAGRTGEPLAPLLLYSNLEQILRNGRFGATEEASPETPTASAPDYDQPEITAPGGWFPPLIQMLMIGLALLALAAVISYLVKNLLVQRAAIALPEAEDIPVTSQAAADKAELLTTTQDFRLAIRYLYLASLLALDEQGIIQYDRSLTNREHVQQLAGQPQLYALMRRVVDVFDRVWYGLAPVDEQVYEMFRGIIEQLRKHA